MTKKFDGVDGFYSQFPLAATDMARNGLALARTSEDPLAILEMTAHAVRYILDGLIGEDLSPTAESRLRKTLEKIQNEIAARHARGEKSDVYRRWRELTGKAIDDDIDRLAAQVDALPPRARQPRRPLTSKKQ